MSEKKDLNELAALEQMFAKDYGKESIRNFRSDWDKNKEKEYLRQLKSLNQKGAGKDSEKINIDGIQVSKRALNKKIERSCPVCKTYSFSGKDDLYMNRFECCFECYVEFVDGREDRWREGWQPDQERIKASLKRRKQNG
jgi:hypothetical protein